MIIRFQWCNNVLVRIHLLHNRIYLVPLIECPSGTIWFLLPLNGESSYLHSFFNCRTVWLVWAQVGPRTALNSSLNVQDTKLHFKAEADPLRPPLPLQPQSEVMLQLFNSELTPPLCLKGDTCTWPPVYPPGLGPKQHQSSSAAGTNSLSIFPETSCRKTRLQTGTLIPSLCLETSSWQTTWHYGPGEELAFDDAILSWFH